MKEMRTEEAVGQILCHDLTQIVRGVTKDARFRKGHVIKEEDVPVLLSMGKDHIFVWENDDTVLHENDAAEILRQLCQNEYMAASEPKEGKIELTAEVDGIFQVDEDRFDEVNELDDVTIATLPQNMPVKAGQKLAGMRVIPLVIKKDKMEQVKQVAGNRPLLRLRPYRHDLKVGVVTTGTEVFLGRIEDTFTPVIESKLRAFGLTINEHRLSDDVAEHTQKHIEELVDLGMDMVICTGGMSVDPDDRTPAAIRDAGAEIITYGAPTLPGAMFLLGYIRKDGREIPVMGLPGCVMYAGRTIFDLVLPRVITGEKLTRKEIRHFGIGGLCMNCKVCHYPVCGFQH
ncbi:molybdopterin-binding protein [Selenomonas ruminantium]|uniref:Molybdopterin molybdenumtransferase n=1 Tax=Selenomonas ruminantium TaxID=971 RepID=A0A1H0QU60_SELRU|nr:molybdopterin-binding protein [Selenomonas ruminantium]SDP20861.1 molybdenum cofactor synthesis domain-containing protein [Selenomonas ruminantium]